MYRKSWLASIITDLGVIDVTDKGLKLVVELASGVTKEEIVKQTGAFWDAGTIE